MPSATTASRQSFVRIDVRVAAGAPAERVMAEAFEAGAVGLEERSEEGGLTLVLYVAGPAAAQVERAVRAVAPAGSVTPPQPLPATDWSELWKRDLGETVVSARLVIRPSWVEHAAGAGQAEVRIDPGQAFGTGAHESTRLALELVDGVADSLAPEGRVLDLGCGSGVLALAVLARSAARVVACDLDPLAAEAAKRNAAANGASARMAVFVGSVAALRPASFDLVVANLLRRELEEVLSGLAASLRPGGRAILSGLLDTEAGEVRAALGALGLEPLETRERRDSSGALWRAWLTGR